jgi:AGCS family alanine or glycine:cation symporter
VVSLATVLFAYSTILGWSYYGEKAFEFLIGSRFVRVYRVLFIAGVMVGAMMQLEFVWNFSDMMNGMMAIPNLIALLLLSNVVSSETTRYFKAK